VVWQVRKAKRAAEMAGLKTPVARLRAKVCRSPSLSSPLPCLSVCLSACMCMCSGHT